MTIIQNMTRERSCKWCGRTFRVPLDRGHNATKYCCKKCSYYAKLEQNLETTRKYYKRFKRFELGTSNFKEKRSDDFKKELKQIKDELKRLGL